MATTTLSANAVLFAINSAVKLGTRFRKAYVNKLQTESLILPLPSFTNTANRRKINDFFDEHGDTFFKDQNDEPFPEIERLKELYDKSKRLGLSPEELKEYQDYYDIFFNVSEGVQPGSSPTLGEDAIEVFTLAQWQNDKMVRPSVLQLVGGSLIEVGIDFFQQVPGALNTASAHGKAIKHFLSALDKIPFAEESNLKKAITQQLVPQLFATAAETVVSLAPEIAGDEKLQNVIQAAAQGLVTDLQGKLMAANSREEREEAINWGQLVLRSLIKNTGEYAFSNTRQLFGTNQAASKLVSRTGLALLDAIVSPDEDGVNLKEVFSADTLDDVIHEAFNTLSEYPQIISGEEGIKKIVVEVSKVMAHSDIKRPGLIPEFIRIILEKAALNARFFWRKTPSGPENLLIVTLEQTLQALAHKDSPDDVWRLSLSNSQLLDIVNNLTDQVIAHPGWIRKPPGDKPSILSLVIGTVLDALSTIPPHQRFSRQTFGHVLEASVRTVATSNHVLDKVKWGSGEDEVMILNKALNLVFEFVHHDPQRGKGGRLALLTDLLDYSLDTILSANPNKKGLILIQLLLFKDSGIDYSSGFNEALADQLISSALSVLDEHTDLITKDDFLTQLISGTAGALNATFTDRKNLLPELVRLLLDNSANNLNLLFELEGDDPKNILVIALRQTLEALSRKENPEDTWRLAISNSQLLDIVNLVTDEVVANPELIAKASEKPSILSTIIESALSALAKMPHAERFSNENFAWLMELSFRTVATSEQVLGLVKWGGGETEVMILDKALDLIFDFVYHPEQKGLGNRLGLLTDLVDYSLETILNQHPDKKGLLLVQLLLFEDSGINYSAGFNEDLADQLIGSAIAVLDEHTELIVKDDFLTKTISDTAQILRLNMVGRDQLLPELVRLMLDSSANNLELLIDASEDEPKHLLVIALRQTLEVLAQKDDPGDVWKLNITNSQILGVVQMVTDEVIANPNLVVKATDKPSLLSLVLHTTLNALHNLPPNERFSNDTFGWLLELNLRTVAGSNHVLDLVKWGGGVQEVMVLEKALDLVFGAVYGTTLPGGTNRIELLADLLDFSIDTILRANPNKKGLVLIQLLLFKDSGIDYSSGFNEHSASQLVDSLIRVLDEHTDLVTHDQVLSKIIAETAQALRSSMSDRENMLPELVRLLIDTTSGNLDLLLRGNENDPQHILVTGLKQVLQAIAMKPTDGKWKPSLTNSQVMEIVNTVFEEILNHPLWAQNEGKLIFDVLHAMFRSLESVPGDQKLPYKLVQILIEDTFAATSTKKEFTVPIETVEGTQQLAIEYSLQEFFLTIYNEETNETLQWNLSQAEVFEALTNHFLVALTQTKVDKDSIDGEIKRFEDVLSDYKNNLINTIDEILSALSGPGSVEGLT